VLFRSSRLASKLTGAKIDIMADDLEDEE
jgi:transcription antitermination factor NusA-like protein